MRTIRASSLPRIMACPASAVAPDIEIDSRNPSAIIGTAAHEWYAAMVGGRDEWDPQADMQRIASKYTVDVVALRMLCYAGRQQWEALKNLLRQPESETALEAQLTDDVTLTGHADVLARTLDGAGVIVDWKTGRVESDHYDQLAGYAALYHHILPDDFDRYLVITAYTRLGKINTVKISRGDLMAWIDDLLDTLDQPGKYVPDPDTCFFCPRAHECPAKAALVTASVTEITGSAPGEMTREKLVELYPQTRMLKKALDDYDTAIRAVLDDAGEPITVPGGTLELATETRDTILYDRELLRGFVGDDGVDEFEDGLTITKTEIKRLCKLSAPAREAGKHAAECIDKFTSEGLVETKEIRKIKFTSEKKGKK